MRHFSSNSFSLRPLLQGFQRISKPVTGLAIAVGMTAFTPIAFATEALGQSAPMRETLRQPLAEGVYLYGQSPTAEQIGSAYMVFEVSDRQIVGAFYMPHSSFDCFQGTIEANRLALNVVDSYEQVSHPYEIALEQSDTVAMAGNAAIAPVQIEGYHRISSVSDNDERMLATCQANLQEQPSETPSAPGIISQD